MSPTTITTVQYTAYIGSVEFDLKKFVQDDLAAEYNLRIFLDSTKEGAWGLKSPWGPGAKPVGGVGERSPPEADIFRLKGIFLRKIRQ